MLSILSVLCCAGGVASSVNHVCSTNFVGTSAGAPLAVGCFALSLQANGTLNWRDLLHLIARTARLPLVVLPGENDWYCYLLPLYFPVYRYVHFKVGLWTFQSLLGYTACYGYKYNSNFNLQTIDVYIKC